VLDQLDIGVGTNVSLSVDNGRLIVEPDIVPKYTLDQLLAECSPDAESSPEDRAWTTGPRSGRELLRWSAAISISCRSILPRVTSNEANDRFWSSRQAPSTG
jgi:antitoxin ChpS